MWESVFVVWGWSHACTFVWKSGFFIILGFAARRRTSSAEPTDQQKPTKEKKEKEKNLCTQHPHSLILASITLRWRAQGCIIAAILRVIRVLTASEGGLISRCGRSGREEATARGMLGLTEALINYGLLPLVMHEKPTESSERSLNQGAYFKGNVATLYWQDAVSVGGVNDENGVQ